jgi:riboflavin synthase
VVALFTGIVSEVGNVEAVDLGEGGSRLRIRAGFARELREGDSVSVAGACLTAAAIGDGWFEADAMNQTLSLTTLGDLDRGDPVNLEPAVRAGDPLGGHLVQGHVDGVGVVREVTQDGIARRLRVEVPAALRRYVAERGSIAIQGVSLTVSACDAETLEVSLIPETLSRTTLGDAHPGARVNLEVDVIARYAERLVTSVDRGGQPQ